MNAEIAANPVIAIIAGRPLTEVPADLFIPPDALEILLDSFSGPLDLLLYLIRRENINILDIPMVHITRQYMHYIQLIEEHRLELAADYLVMAAMLAEIKSRLLLPPSLKTEEEIEEDPRFELVRKLQAYEQIKHAAEALDNLPRCERDLFRFGMPSPKTDYIVVQPEVSLAILTKVMNELIKKENHSIPHQITREALSVRERMALVLEQLQNEPNLVLTQLYKKEEGRMGLVVSLLAILELARQSLLFITQTQVYAPIHIQVGDYE